MPSTWLLLQLALSAVSLILLTIVVRRCTLVRARSRQKRIEAEARQRTARRRLGLDFPELRYLDGAKVIAECVRRNKEHSRQTDRIIKLHKER